MKNENNKMVEWAESEVKVFKAKADEYCASCAESALKAYKTLIEDGHSGNSWKETRYLLMKLMSGEPLSSITDDDFNGVEGYRPATPEGIVSVKQCPRMSSLFRTEYEDGTVKYLDLNRVWFYDTHCSPDVSCSSRLSDEVIEELYPITMPYIGGEKYKVYGETFFSEDYNEMCYFDTIGISYIILPGGEKVKVNRYFKELHDGEKVKISKKEYEERLKRAKAKTEEK